MSTAADEELRALRARAYGPTADIEDDPAALRRLQQLEARRQPRPRAEDVVPPAPAMETIDSEPTRAAEPVSRARRSRRQPEDAEGDALGVFDTSADDADAAPPTAEPAERLAAWFSVRTTRILWVVAIVAAAAMSAAVTFALVKVTPVASSAGAPQIATLDATSDVVIPAGWMGVGPSSAVFDFYGLVIVESSGGYYNGSVGSDCLTVARADQVPDKDDFDSSNGWTYDGPMYTGCAVGAFPATVEVPFDTNMPKELTERFPDGTALQFVYEADRVGVFLDSE
ncbi:MULTISPECIES: hypothetical protein [unclassified Microbacterium]|uniref:hypothetical protein n=1 Tax=unclassified Microbacterium TaxID=2609290 RepID=UPI000DE4430F|nr:MULTISPECIES: hypothetical protein [unclassified Microbacterium]NYF27017.1 hypothetical protein [Microbacterium sp. JAI119]RBO72477.1 hypothetical protein DSP71_10630 [Microbacterium sp. H6]